MSLLRRGLSAGLAAVSAVALASCDPTPAHRYFGITGTRDNPVVVIHTCMEQLRQLELLHYPNIDTADRTEPSFYLAHTVEWSVTWTSPTASPVRASFSGDISDNGTVTRALRFPLKSKGYFLRVVTSKRDSSFSIEDLSRVESDKFIVSSLGGEWQLPADSFHKQAKKDCPK